MLSRIRFSCSLVAFVGPLLLTTVEAGKARNKEELALFKNFTNTAAIYKSFPRGGKKFTSFSCKFPLPEVETGSNMKNSNRDRQQQTSTRFIFQRFARWKNSSFSSFARLLLLQLSTMESERARREELHFRRKALSEAFQHSPENLFFEFLLSLS